MKLWVDATTDFTGGSDGAELEAVGEAQFQADQTINNVVFASQVERALLRRRLELTRFEQEAWEYRWRFDMSYMTGIELCLREQITRLEELLRVS